jgi:DNA-directed RNA polymerase specialized sigma24 family protein
MIKLLGGMRLSGGDIASLLGVSATTVAPILSRTRAATKKGKNGRGGGSRKKK